MNIGNNKSDTVKKIVILGGGTAGWMTAAAFSKLLPKSHYQITLVESEQIGTVGVGEATLPSLRAFNKRLGIDEAEFMEKTKATFKLGIEFSNWGKYGQKYVHPFGDFGEPIDGIPSYHYWLKHRQSGGITSFEQYSIVNQLCAAKKFSFPCDQVNSPLANFSYAYHLDATLYAKYLAGFSQKNAVLRVEGKVVDVIQRASDQYIQSLILEDGNRIEGDFFIDCSGFSGRLIKQVLNVGYEDWSHWLPCNRAIAIASQSTETINPYTQAFAHDSGWQWRIPLQHRTGNGIVYCDRYKNEDQALDNLLETLTNKAISEPNYFKFSAGKLDNQWYKNCVAIGLSSGLLEPLESTAIHLIQMAIMQLIDSLPTGQNDQHQANEFNRVMDNELVRIRDFLIVHYHANARDDSPFWRDCKQIALPETLNITLELFKKTARLDLYQHGLFLEPSWLAVLLGQGYFPDNYDPRLVNVNPLWIENKLALRREKIAKEVAQSQYHHQFLAQRFSQSTAVNKDKVGLVL